MSASVPRTTSDIERQLVDALYEVGPPRDWIDGIVGAAAEALEGFDVAGCVALPLDSSPAGAVESAARGPLGERVREGLAAGAVPGARSRRDDADLRGARQALAHWEPAYRPGELRTIEPRRARGAAVRDGVAGVFRRCEVTNALVMCSAPRDGGWVAVAVAAGDARASVARPLRVLAGLSVHLAAAAPHIMRLASPGLEAPLTGSWAAAMAVIDEGADAGQVDRWELRLRLALGGWAVKESWTSGGTRCMVAVEQELAPRLTARQRTVVMATARGRSPAEIGDALGISAATARTHLKTALRRLRLHGRKELLSRLARPLDARPSDSAADD